MSEVKPFTADDLAELRNYAFRDRGGEPIGVHGVRYQRLLATIDADRVEIESLRQVAMVRTLDEKSRQTIHKCGENGAPCYGVLSHAQVEWLANLNVTPVRTAFGYGRYQGHRQTRDKYERILAVMDERVRLYQARASSAEGELRGLRAQDKNELLEATTDADGVTRVKRLSCKSCEQREQYVIATLRILAPIIQDMGVTPDLGDDDEFEGWLDREQGFPFTDCHNCGGDVGTPRKWLSHDCANAKPTIPDYCDECDGCGWYEGGPTIKTTCAKCKGTGIKTSRKTWTHL